MVTFWQRNLVGLGRLELPTSPLSGVRSNQAELQTHSRGSGILQQKMITGKKSLKKRA